MAGVTAEIHLQMKRVSLPSHDREVRCGRGDSVEGGRHTENGGLENLISSKMKIS